MLSIDSLRTNAIAKAGTDEFGDEWGLEPLGVLSRAVVPLTAGGEAVLRQVDGGEGGQQVAVPEDQILA